MMLDNILFSRSAYEESCWLKNEQIELDKAWKVLADIKQNLNKSPKKCKEWFNQSESTRQPQLRSNNHARSPPHTQQYTSKFCPETVTTQFSHQYNENITSQPLHWHQGQLSPPISTKNVSSQPPHVSQKQLTHNYKTLSPFEELEKYKTWSPHEELEKQKLHANTNNIPDYANSEDEDEDEYEDILKMDFYRFDPDFRNNPFNFDSPVHPTPSRKVEPVAFNTSGYSTPTTASNHMSASKGEPQDVAVSQVLNSPFTPIQTQRSVAAELETAPEPGPAWTQEAFQPARSLTIPRLKKYFIVQVAILVQLWSPFYSIIKLSSGKCKIVSFAIGMIYNCVYHLTKQKKYILDNPFNFGKLVVKAAILVQLGLLFYSIFLSSISRSEILKIGTVMSQNFLENPNPILVTYFRLGLSIFQFDRG